MGELSFEDVLWVCCDHEQGSWWPGIFLSLAKDTGLMMKAIRLRALHQEQRNQGVQKMSSTGRVGLFWIPYLESLVASTQWCNYDQEPPMLQRVPQSSVSKHQTYFTTAKAQMEHIRSCQDDGGSSLSDSTPPASPASTLLDHYGSIGFPPSGTDISSPQRCMSAENISREICGASVLSTDTEVEESALEFFSSPGRAPTSSIPRASELDGCALSQERAPGDEGGCQTGSSIKAYHSQGSSYSGIAKLEESNSLLPKCGAKRPRADTRCEVRVRDEESDSAGDCREDRSQPNSPKCSVAFTSPGLKRQRMRSSRASREVVKHRMSTKEPDIMLKMVQYDGMQGDIADDDVRDGNKRVEEPLPNHESHQRSSMHQLVGAQASLSVEKVTATNRRVQDGGMLTVSNPDRIAHDSSGLCDTPTGKFEAEAASFREVGITGNEHFDELFGKLRRIKWAWGPLINKLASDYYIKKPGAKIKTAKLGTDIFTSKDDVVRYVRNVLERGGQTQHGARMANVSSDIMFESKERALSVMDSQSQRASGMSASSQIVPDFDAQDPLGRSAQSQRKSGMLHTPGETISRCDEQDTSGRDVRLPCKSQIRDGSDVAISEGKHKISEDTQGEYNSGVLPENDSQKMSGRDMPSRHDLEMGDAPDQRMTKCDQACTIHASCDGLETKEMQELHRALEALSPSNAPRILKQRAEEFEQVLEFVTTTVKGCSGGSIYLCGCPGTGKTQTVAHVKAKILDLVSKGHLPGAQFHDFAGTSFTNPRAMHSALWGIMTGQSRAPLDLEKALGERFKLAARKPTSSHPMMVVILDEIDQLMSQNQHVLRKLFEWADLPRSRLVLVGIANSMEFDIGFFSLRKMPTKVIFPAYTPADLSSILGERVGTIMEPGAIKLCARKVASTHGDARRAIGLCREAVNIAKDELDATRDAATSSKDQDTPSKYSVTIGHMARALKAGCASQYEKVIAGLSTQAQVILCVAAVSSICEVDLGVHQSERIRSGNRIRLTQGALHDKCASVLGKLRTGAGLSQVEFSGTIDILVAQGLMNVAKKQRMSGRARELILQIGWLDVVTALGDRPFFKAATKR